MNYCETVQYLITPSSEPPKCQVELWSDEIGKVDINKNIPSPVWRFLANLDETFQDTWEKLLGLTDPSWPFCNWPTEYWITLVAITYSGHVNRYDLCQKRQNRQKQTPRSILNEFFLIFNMPYIERK